MYEEVMENIGRERVKKLHVDVWDINKIGPLHENTSHRNENQLYQ